MKYNELQVSASKSRKRVGRGDKTAGRGTKGQGARTGKKLNAMFQGGSGALVRRTPKARGFKSIRTPAQVVYLDHLNTFKGKVVDNMSLYEAGLIATPFHTVKIIARGELKEKVTLRVQAASKSVQAAIEKAGGTFEKTPTPVKQSEKAAEAAEQNK
ncbi:MAG TPA: 50S ribosomal protein L15 [Candidatus Saccharimonadales bacterium]|nr:50S ribosomal protein L15 [Candidatus Saccharimonadales bacterium]